MNKLNTLLKTYGVSVVFMELEGNGYYIAPIRTIVVNKDLEEGEQNKVILHELGHHLFHHDVLSLYKMDVPHSKMESEANRFMIKELFKEYTDLFQLSPEEVNYLTFMDYYKLDYSYEKYIKELILEHTNNAVHK